MSRKDTDHWDALPMFDIPLTGLGQRSTSFDPPTVESVPGYRQGSRTRPPCESTSPRLP